MTNPDMDSREQAIIDLVRDRGLVAIGGLAKQFGVTPQTIRRSANQLSERGLLRRVHGGLTLPASGANLPWDTRQVQHLEGKQRIAAAVASHIPHGASLSIGLGTTPHQVALALREHCDLHVVTNSLRVVFALTGSKGLQITVAGGLLRPTDMDVVGEAAAACFTRFKTDYAVFGVGGIDADGDLLDFDPAEVVAREAMRRHCRESLLVADISKFGRRAMACGGHLNNVSHLFLDAPPPPAFGPMVSGNSTQVHVATTTGAAA